MYRTGLAQTMTLGGGSKNVKTLEKDRKGQGQRVFRTLWGGYIMGIELG